MALLACLTLAAAGPLAAQQPPQTSPAQPSIMSSEDQDVAPATPSPAKPPRHTHVQTAAQAKSTNPDLDTDDELAPSQLKQPMPAAVSEPGGGAARAPAHPAKHAASADPDPTAAAVAKPAAAAKSAGPTAPHVVACSGAFSKDSSHLRLAMTFETKNVTFADVDGDGGAKVPATVLFPNDPKRRLEVWWSNPASRRDTYLVVIGGQSTWSAPGGMKLGLTLAQLEKLNHKPFKLKGFDKDGIAKVSDWDGGVLADLPGGCKSGLSLRADPKAPADAVGALSVDKEYSSSDAAVRAVKPTVSEVLIGY
jgi:hypothetical protein